MNNINFKVLRRICFLAIFIPSISIASNNSLINISKVKVLPNKSAAITANIQWDLNLNDEEIVLAAQDDEGVWKILAKQNGNRGIKGHEKLYITLTDESVVLLEESVHSVLTLSQNGAVRVVNLDHQAPSGSVGPGLADWGCANLAIESGAELNGCDMTAADLSGSDLNDIDLSDSQLQLINLNNANVSGSDFSGSNFSYADLSDISSANMLQNTALKDQKSIELNVQFASTSSIDCPIVGAGEVIMNYTIMKSTDLSGANLACSQMEGTLIYPSSDLTNADLSFSDMHYGGIGGSNVDNLRLINTDLTYAEISIDPRRVVFFNTNLTGATFFDVLFPENEPLTFCYSKDTIWPDETTNPPSFVVAAVCNNLNLSNAYLVGLFMPRFSDLSNVNFSAADLTRASFHDADLTKSNFSNANLTSAQFDDADLSMADLRNANLSSTTLIGTNLSHADLSGANLNGAHLLFTDTRGANFSNSNLDSADPYDLYFCYDNTTIWPDGSHTPPSYMSDRNSCE